MVSLKSMGVNLKQYAMVAAGGLGLTGGRALSGPLQAQIGIADPCNHKCVFCWDHPPDDRQNPDTAQRFGLARPGVMPFEQFRAIVDDLYDLGTRHIDLIGRGEPLLNHSALDMVRYAKGRGMQLMMTTNASRLFEPIAQGFVDVRMDRVHVSLNAGTTESPENYVRVKKNLRFLSDYKIAVGSDLPYLSLSFVISSKNYFEISDMIEVAHEVGAQETTFIHTVLHQGTPDLALTEAQYEELTAALPAARDKAEALGVSSNLATFGATVPPYMPSEMVGPAVVPCYVGWYFAVILGNGSVMPCCQCAAPIGQITKERRFSDIWASRDYTNFRSAAKALPKKDERLNTCECDNCQLRPRNLALHNLLHPLSRIPAGQDVQVFSARDFLRKIRGEHGNGLAE
jgi:radical SAM protein with 4Fe4S-binding SPASM domain